MSLINKMLQDLDARGSHGADPMQADIKSVVRPERGVSAPLAVGAVVGVCLLGAAGLFGWRYYQRLTVPVMPRPLVQAPAPAPVPVPVPVPKAVAPVAPVVPVALPEPLPEPEPVAPAAPARVKKVVKEKAKVVDKKPADKLRLAEKKLIDKKLAEQKLAAKKKPTAAPVPQPAAPRGETEYRRALTSLQEGRVSDAIATLEQALRLDPRHDAARQTLVGLLLENKRQDDAVRVLQAGLTLDPRQPSLAMLLARLQIERGGSGIETLMRTLPSAVGNGGYHALLGGALQREQRYREAAEQYQAALRTASNNGVWLMGLGIALQADKRHGEALEAFQRSKASGTLSAELLSFVERRLQQLAR